MKPNSTCYACKQPLPTPKTIPAGSLVEHKMAMFNNQLYLVLETYVQEKLISGLDSAETLVCIGMNDGRMYTLTPSWVRVVHGTIRITSREAF